MLNMITRIIFYLVTLFLAIGTFFAVFLITLPVALITILIDNFAIANLFKLPEPSYRTKVSKGNEATETLLKTPAQNSHGNTGLPVENPVLYGQTGFHGDRQANIGKSRQEIIALNNQGVLLAKEGKLDEAIKLLSDARKLLPENKRITANLANMAVLSMRQNGRSDYLMQLAKECLEQTAKLNRQS